MILQLGLGVMPEELLGCKRRGRNTYEKDTNFTCNYFSVINEGGNFDGKTQI